MSNERKLDNYGNDKPVNLCGLWTSKSGNGQSTSLSDRTLDTMLEVLQAERAKPAEERGRLMVWANKFSQGDRDPTHKMVVLPNNRKTLPPPGLLPGEPKGDVDW